MLQSTNALTYLGVSQVQKKDKSGYWDFVKLGDNEKFESYEFIKPMNSPLNIDGLVHGDKVLANFDLGLFNGRPNITLVALEKSKQLAK